MVDGAEVAAGRRDRGGIADRGDLLGPVRPVAPPDLLGRHRRRGHPSGRPARRPRRPRKRRDQLAARHVAEPEQCSIRSAGVLSSSMGLNSCSSRSPWSCCDQAGWWTSPRGKNSVMTGLRSRTGVLSIASRASTRRVSSSMLSSRQAVTPNRLPHLAAARRCRARPGRVAARVAGSGLHLAVGDPVNGYDHLDVGELLEPGQARRGETFRVEGDRRAHRLPVRRGSLVPGRLHRADRCTSYAVTPLTLPCRRAGSAGYHMHGRATSPRSRHSARCGRSAPSVLSPPWPR